MKTENEIREQISIHINNLVSADTIEEVKFCQGAIRNLNWIITEKVEEKQDG